jgi:Na+/proline symporter
MAHYMRIGKVVMLVIMGIAIFVAYHAQNFIDIAVFMLGLSSAELTANWGQWWWWRFNGKARLAASFGGPVIFLINKFVIFNYLIEARQDTAY